MHILYYILPSFILYPFSFSSQYSVGNFDDAQVARDREDVISITKDVQKFVAKIAELRQVIEETDAAITQGNNYYVDFGFT